MPVVAVFVVVVVVRPRYIIDETISRWAIDASSFTVPQACLAPVL
jgi:hypothetical protein